MRKEKRGLYYQKDKKAQIYKLVSGSVDEDGFPVNDYWTPVSSVPLWCYTRQLSQDQLYAAHAFLNDETRLFVFNYRNDVKQYDLIHYTLKGGWYEVTRVDTADDYNGELFVYVKNLKAAPDPSKIKPFAYDPITA